MKIDHSFQHNYSFEVLQEVKTGYKIYYFPGASTKGGKDGTILQIIPNVGEPWIGIFAFAHQGVFTGIFTTPNPESICVICEGQGIIVSTINPENWQEVRLLSIQHVYPNLKYGMLIFANTRMIAYDAKGMKWETKRLVADIYLKIEVSDDSIKGEGEYGYKFEVDMASGKTIGGTPL